MSRLSNTIRATMVAALAAAAAAGPALGQDQRLVEEVVAHVNADVITSSQYNDVLRETENDFKANFPADQAQAKFLEFKPQILQLMIDNILLVQKGEELGIDVESQINQQLKAQADQQHVTITELEDSMRQAGLDPSDVRKRLRDRFMREQVLNQEVYGNLWRGLTEKEKREFYDAHKDKFMQPGELKLSEVFIPVEGRSFGEIEAKGKEVAAAARSGQAFPELVKKYGDPTRASYANAGSLGSFKAASELAEPLAKAVEPLKTGEITEPIRMADGVILIHVDERREAAPKKFEEVANDVALAIVYDRSHDIEQKYVKKLRDEAYIKISEGYAPPPAPASDKAKK